MERDVSAQLAFSVFLLPGLSSAYGMVPLPPTIKPLGEHLRRHTQRFNPIVNDFEPLLSPHVSQAGHTQRVPHLSWSGKSGEEGASGRRMVWSF